MKKTSSQPCSAWTRHLTALSPSDMSEVERAKLQAHLHTCSACMSAYQAYTFMQTAILQLPPIVPLKSFSPQEFEGKSMESTENVLVTQAIFKPHIARTGVLNTRMGHLTNQLVAVLVIGALLAGSLLLFSHHYTRTQVGGATSPVALPPQPIPAGMCAYAGPALKYLCAQHQLTTIDRSYLLGGIPVTLAYAYADSNQICMLFFQHPAKPLPYSIQINDSSPVSSDGRSFYGLGGWGNGNFYYFYYDAATVPVGTMQLDLRWKVNYYDITKSNAPLASITFKLQLPIHAIQRVATPRQTITMNGLSVTLDRVVVAPSSTFVYLHGGPTVPGSLTWLKVGNSTNRRNPPGGWTPSTLYTTDALFWYAIPLYQSRGAWTFTIQPAGSKPCVFHFSVPPPSLN